MAPIALTESDVEGQLKQIIHDLYCLMIQSYDYQGPRTEEAMTNQIRQLITHLKGFASASRTLPTTVPPEIIEYIENGRNPDIYTREFVELAQRMNQQLKGKSKAFADFRDALAREISGAIPELAADVDGVLLRTGRKGWIA